jgi:hypothetical protein
MFALKQITADCNRGNSRNCRKWRNSRWLALDDDRISSQLFNFNKRLHEELLALVPVENILPHQPQRRKQQTNML